MQIMNCESRTTFFFFFFNILLMSHSGENICYRKVQKTWCKNHCQKSLSEDFPQAGHPGWVLGASLGWWYLIPSPFRGAWGTESLCSKTLASCPLPFLSDHTLPGTHRCLVKAQHGPHLQPPLGMCWIKLIYNWYLLSGIRKRAAFPLAG